MIENLKQLELETGGRRFRVTKEDSLFYPEWKSIWTFFRWKKFYFSRDNELEDFVFLRAFKTEDEAWDFIRKKMNKPKFTNYDIIDGGE